MKTFAAAIFFVLFSFFPAAAQTENGGLRRLSDKEIDAQLRNMQDLLPVEIQSGIRWVDIKRSGREIKYTYIVNVNSAEWSDGERMAMMTRLQDFGWRAGAAANRLYFYPADGRFAAAGSSCRQCVREHRLCLPPGSPPPPPITTVSATICLTARSTKKSAGRRKCRKNELCRDRRKCRRFPAGGEKSAFRDCRFPRECKNFFKNIH